MVNHREIKSKKTIKELLEFGIINVDKPSGPTSFDISDFVRKKLKDFGVRKTSHFGTLDPKVTGVLPAALNRACKLTGFFLGEDKEYIGIMRIHKDVSLNKIKETIKEKFTGKITQLPPVKSRVKRQERRREIKKFELLEKEERDILFHAEVEGGTYIRKLISDLGDEMKIGAHMLELRRIRAGIFGEKNIVNLYDFEKAIEGYKKGGINAEERLRNIIIPAEEAIIKIYPVINIKSDSVKKLFTGKQILHNDVKGKDKAKIKSGQIVCTFDKNKFIGMYRIINQGDIFAKPEFVLQPLK